MDTPSVLCFKLFEMCSSLYHVTLDFVFKNKEGRRQGGAEDTCYSTALRFSNSRLPTVTSLAQLLVWLMAGSLFFDSVAKPAFNTPRGF